MIPPSLKILLLAVGGVWLAGCLSGLLSLLWSMRPKAGRFHHALIAGMVALAIGVVGLNYFKFTFSQTVNGESWSFDSNGFFVALIALGGISLGLALSRKKVLQHQPVIAVEPHASLSAGEPATPSTNLADRPL